MRQEQKNVAIIGLGLIGGSLAFSLKRRGSIKRITGIDHNSAHIQEAMDLQMIDAGSTTLEELEDADLIILAVQVDGIKRMLPSILDRTKEGQVVVDMGSTKGNICRSIEGHPARHRFVAMHPIAGTENTGPSAAFHGLFKDRVMILSETERSGKASLQTAEAMTDDLGMERAYMEDPDEHDRHIAYVSHLSHISSFILGTTVLEKEQDETNIFLMAGSGFASTVRLAKSSPDMWAPIFEDNAKKVSDALESYIEKLQAFKRLVDQGQTKETHEVMRKANDIRRVLDGIEPRELAVKTQSSV